MSGGSKCGVCKITCLLTVIGALNWGLVGIFQLDIVERLLGIMTGPARIVYTIIGIAGLVTLLSAFGCCPCTKKSCETK